MMRSTTELLRELNTLDVADPDKLQADLATQCAAMLNILLRPKMRDRHYLRNKHLIPMVRDGQLVLRYPDTPNHPNQRYTMPEVEHG